MRRLLSCRVSLFQSKFDPLALGPGPVGLGSQQSSLKTLAATSRLPADEILN